MRDELLEIAGPDPPALIEPHRREARKFVSRKPEDLEVRPPTIERDSLLPSRGDLDRRGWELASDLRQLLRRNRDGAHCLDVCGDLGAHRDVEIRPGQANPLIRGLHENVREDGQGSLGGNARRHGCQPFLELLSGNRKPHHRSCVAGVCKGQVATDLLSKESDSVAVVVTVELWANSPTYSRSVGCIS